MSATSDKVAAKCRERFTDPALAAAVIKDIEDNDGKQENTKDLMARIARGECTLPSEQDARHWHDRKLYGRVLTDLERQTVSQMSAQETRIVALEKQIADLLGSKQQAKPAARRPAAEESEGSD